VKRRDFEAQYGFKGVVHHPPMDGGGRG
jgi:hypothetical protein